MAIHKLTSESTLYSITYLGQILTQESEGRRSVAHFQLMLGRVSAISRTSAPDRLTSNQEGTRVKSVKRTVNSVVVFCLVLFFASAVLCATMAAPGQSLASVPGCSQDNHATEMTGCEHPSYLCDFINSFHVLSQSTLSSAHFEHSVKNILRMVIGEPPCDSTVYGGAFLGNEHTSALLVRPHKVPIYLYNSVLTL